jgi:hypothetical protein
MFEFDPDEVARLEAAGWRAYYDRDWFKLASVMVRLCRTQFHIPWPLAVVAAVHVARGSIAWARPKNDPRKVERHFRRFYRIARRYSGLRFVPTRAAELEVRYWIEHRRLVGIDDKTPFIEAMTDLHSHLFDIPQERARESAEWRVRANNTVDEITSGRSTDPEADWAKLEDELRRCYRSVQRELKAA